MGKALHIARVGNVIPPGDWVLGVMKKPPVAAKPPHAFCAFWTLLKYRIVEGKQRTKLKLHHWHLVHEKHRGRVNKKLIRPQLAKFFFFHYQHPKKAPKAVHCVCQSLLSAAVFPLLFTPWTSEFLGYCTGNYLERGAIKLRAVIHHRTN